MRLSFKQLLALVAAVLAAGITIAVVVDDGPGPSHHRSVTVHIGKQTLVDNADADAKANDPVALAPPARKVAQSFAADPRDLVGNLRGPDHGPIAKLLPPFAADEIPGCRTRFLRTNWSYRTVAQSDVELFWLHFTGGPDKPGTRAEVDGLTAYGNQPSAGVSWHFNMDKDGNCDYNVPLRYKAWTEAGANSTGISIEVAGVGDAPYLRAGGVRELRRIVDAVHQRYPKIRVVLGGVSNCRPTKPGIVTHYMGGPCSGGHTDIRPLSLAAVVHQLQAAAPDPIAKARRSHRIVHAKIAKRCRGAERHSAGCQALFKRNGELHAKWKGVLS
jgi:hypothetical protein